MKAILHTSLLAILGLALGSCSSGSNMASTEYDDMYHRPSDRTVAVDNRTASPSTYTDGTEAPQANNPEYDANAGNDTNSNARRRNSSTDEYYTDNYDYHYSSRIRRFHSPYVGAGYYDPFYTDYYYYNPRAAYYGSIYSGYFYTSPGAWGYDPFWHPRPWGYSPGITISIGYGWGSPWYSPYYGPYYGGWGSPYYSPYYGYNNYSAGYYHGFYEGATSGGGNGNKHVYGRRGDRSSTAGNFSNGTGGRSNGNTGGRGSSNGRLAAPDMNSGRQNMTATGRNATDFRPASGRTATPSANTPSRSNTGRNADVPSPSAPGRTNNNDVYQPAPSRSGRTVQSPEQLNSPRDTRQAVPQQNNTGRDIPATLPGRGNTTPAPSRSNDYQAPAQNPERTISEPPIRSRGENLPQAPVMDRTPDRAPVNATPPAEAPQRGRGLRGIFGGTRQEPSVSPNNAPSAPRQPTYSAPAPSRNSGGNTGGGGGGRSSGGSSGGGGRRSR